MQQLWQRWKRFGRKMGDFQARLLLSFFYFVIIPPFALLIQWFADPLELKTDTSQEWHPIIDVSGASSENLARRQF